MELHWLQGWQFVNSCCRCWIFPKCETETQYKEWKIPTAFFNCNQNGTITKSTLNNPWEQKLRDFLHSSTFLRIDMYWSALFSNFSFLHGHLELEQKYVVLQTQKKLNNTTCLSALNSTIHFQILKTERYHDEMLDILGSNWVELKANNSSKRAKIRSWMLALIEVLFGRNEFQY